jgi:hypothetical protein
VAGLSLRRLANELEDLGLQLDDVPDDVKPKPLADRVGLTADRRSLAQSLAAKRGRPATYSQDMAEAICSRLVEGQTITEICLELEDAPHLTTIYKWAAEDTSFARAIQEARRLQATTIAELAYVRARDAGPFEVGAAANYLKAVQWLASKLDPHGYGEKSLPVGASLNIADMAEADLEGLMATLQAEKNARAQARNVLPDAKKEDNKG